MRQFLFDCRRFARRTKGQQPPAVQQGLGLENLWWVHQEIQAAICKCPQARIVIAIGGNESGSGAASGVVTRLFLALKQQHTGLAADLCRDRRTGHASANYYYVEGFQSA